MKKKILLFSRDAGGTNTIFPLIDPLKERGYEVKLFGKEISLDRYKQFGFKGQDISEKFDTSSIKSLVSFLKIESPDFIITGTSENDFTERFIWAAANELNIPSFAILDQWCNYGVRFSNYNSLNLAKYDIEKKHPYLPTKILVMDDYAKKKMIETGIEEEKVLVSGQPYFDYISLNQDNISIIDIEKCRNFFNCDKEDLLILFASEPITLYYNETSISNSYWGYTEKTIFNAICETLLNIKYIEKINKKIKVIIRIHPKEPIDNYKDLLELYTKKGLLLILDASYNPYILMKSSDLILGMSSMFLIEAAIFKKPIISIQIGLKRENPFILHQKGFVKTILHKNELYEKLLEFLNGRFIPIQDLDFKFGAIQMVIRYMEEILCQN